MKPLHLRRQCCTSATKCSEETWPMRQFTIKVIDHQLGSWRSLHSTLRKLPDQTVYISRGASNLTTEQIQEL